MPPPSPARDPAHNTSYYRKLGVRGVGGPLYTNKYVQFIWTSFDILHAVLRSCEKSILKVVKLKYHQSWSILLLLPQQCVEDRGVCKSVTLWLQSCCCCWWMCWGLECGGTCCVLSGLVTLQQTGHRHTPCRREDFLKTNWSNCLGSASANNFTKRPWTSPLKSVCVPSPPVLGRCYVWY